MASNVSLLDGVKDVLFGGIRPDIPGHGGEECANFLTVKSLTLETMLSLSVMGILGIFAALTYTMPKHYPRSDDFRSKHMMLVFASLLFGIEIGYKLCSKQVLYLLNPCHVITMVEVGPLVSGRRGEGWKRGGRKGGGWWRRGGGVPELWFI